MAKRRDWTDLENAALCRAWCLMFMADLTGKAVNKSAVRRELIGTDSEPGILHSRSHGSIEAKLMNISAAAVAIGIPALPGYKPASNYQASLRVHLMAAIEETGLDFAPGFTPKVASQ